MATKSTSTKVSRVAAATMSLSDDEIWKLVVTYGGERAVTFPQFCRDVRALAASALAQDETPGNG